LRAGGTTALVLGALLLAACAEKEPQYDQELTLNFKDPKKGYEIVLDGGADGGIIRRMINPGSRQVILQITGARVERIHIIVYDQDHNPICEIDVYPEPEDPTKPIEVKATCSEAPPPPPPDAGPLPDDAADAGADSGPDATPDTGPSPACQSYCQDMLKNCSDVYQGSNEDCLATCAAYEWPAGQPPGFAASTVACRHQRAIEAPSMNSPLLSCYRAGPTGGRYCGKLCENYCEAAGKACPELLGGRDVAGCKVACQEPAGVPAYRSDSGDTLECRIFWMGEALKKKDGTICARLDAKAQMSLCHD
jgi:hypothetical protein